MPAETHETFPDPRDQKRYHFDVTPFRQVLTPTLRAAFTLFSTIDVNGLETFPESGAVILAANHVSIYDMFPMQFVLPRPIFFMAKAELHNNQILDLVLRQLGSFPVNRGARDQWALNHARQILEHGQVLGIFPEGTRNRGDGLHTAKTGAARLALEVKCPIVPMAVSGTQHMFQRFPRRVPVTINIGQPIYPEARDTALGLTDRMMFALAEMLPRAMRGAYTERPPGF